MSGASAVCVSPSWLHNKFLEIALRSGGDDGITVMCSSVIPATAVGDNYMSEMFRIKVEIAKGGQKEERSLILKTEPKVQSLLKITSEGNLFNKESKMFRDILPAMHAILQEASPGKYQKFGAEHIYSTANPATLIMLEDLKASGFRMAERMLGMDMDHCRLVLKTLAQYHAASLALREKDPSIFEPFMTTIFCDEMRSNVEGFFTSSIDGLAKEVEKWPKYNERFAEKLHKLAEKSMDIWIDAIDRTDGEFSALIHGDLWLNNIMFRYSQNDNKVQDVRFVDFQLCYWTSPTVDLLYFLNSSPSLDIAENYDEFLDIYHKSLGDTLEKLGLGRLHPPLEKLKMEMHKRGAFGAVAGIAIRSVVLADRDNIPDMDKVINDGEGAPMSQTFKNAMMKMLPFYEKRGWL